jgi:hypothetical protein
MISELELEGIWKETIMFLFNVQPEHLPTGTEAYHQKIFPDW